MVVRFTESESHVHRRCGTFEDTEGSNDRGRQAVVGLVDLEVL